MDIKQRYWDSNCFLAWFLNESGKADKCRGVIEAAEADKLQIVTSALTITEVIKLKGKPRLKQDRERIIQDFFEQEYIVIRNVDRKVALYARQLLWEFEALLPKDSIHVATALVNKLPVLDTFDEYLIKLDGKLGNPGLRIGYPDAPFQGSLFSKEDNK